MNEYDQRLRAIGCRSRQLVRSSGWTSQLDLPALKNRGDFLQHVAGQQRMLPCPLRCSVPGQPVKEDAQLEGTEGIDALGQQPTDEPRE